MFFVFLAVIIYVIVVVFITAWIINGKRAWRFKRKDHHAHCPSCGGSNVKLINMSQNLAIYQHNIGAFNKEKQQGSVTFRCEDCKYVFKA